MTKWYALLSLVLFADPASAVQGPGEDPRPASTIAAAPSFNPVTSGRLRYSDAEPHNWLMYSGNYSSQRYSGLSQVHIQNVDQLQMQWVHQLRVLDRSETTPLVIDGVMYVTEAPSTVIALDARTGDRYWRYEHEIPEDLNFCCGRNNRGVAVLGNRVFMSTLDAHLVALDARTGNLLWDAEVAKEESGYSKTAAPLVVGDKVITGIAGGEFGIRGFVDAYDVKTGERVWRLYTIPGPGEPGNETWAGDSWRTGGSATWMTGSYDPELNLVYWGTGNPGPDWNGDVRLGDNLYSDAVLAIDPDTGELKWYFQFTPHDVHDWDSTQIPILADSRIDGRDRKLMLWPNRNAFFYVLDRETGEFLHGKPYARQTWAEGLDKKGHPIRIPNTFPSLEGTTVSPSIGGGLELVVAELQSSHGSRLRQRVRRRDHLLRPRRGVHRGRAVYGWRRRDALTGRQIPQRDQGYLTANRRYRVGIPHPAEIRRGRALDCGRSRLQRHARRLLFRVGRVDRRGAVVCEPRLSSPLGAHELHG